MDRRSYLRIAGLGTLWLAGCTGGGDGTEPPTDSPTPSPTDSPTPTPSPAATPTPTASPSPPTESPTPTPSPSPTPTIDADMTVEVGPGGRLRFEPESFEISAGDTVLWVFRAGGHNVKPGSIPNRSDWTGTPGEQFETFNSGYRYSYTFEISGEYGYFCAPHRSSGMVGEFTVG